MVPSAILNNHLAGKPDSVDALSLLREIYWRTNEVPAYQDATLMICRLHLKARPPEAAWEDYEEFLSSGGSKLPAVTWLELRRVAEEQQQFDRALMESNRLAKTYPAERQALMAQLGAARICLKRLNRPEEALKFYEAVSGSAVPHLDLEQTIQVGIREAKAAVSSMQVSPASTSA